MTVIVLKTLFWVSLAATVYTYFLYPLLLVVASRIRGRAACCRSEEVGADSALPFVTMVISAHNEEAVLEEKIANCKRINYPSDKITFLIGSDGSTDRTESILKAIEDPRFRVLHRAERSGKAGMLNYLMGQAAGELVVFSDANSLYDPQAIRCLVGAFDYEQVGCAIGKLELISNDQADSCHTEGMYWRYENGLKKLESSLGLLPTVNGGIFAIRRALFEEFPGQAITEDQVLGMRILSGGYRCLFVEGARACESVSSWTGELRRRVRISAGNFQSLFLVPRILHPRCGWVSFSFISHKLLRWLAPFFLATMLVVNVILAGTPFYGGTMFVQGVFYLSGMIGMAVPKIGTAWKILSVPKYFLVMNAAIVLGLTRFLLGRQRVTWTKTR